MTSLRTRALDNLTFEEKKEALAALVTTAQRVSALDDVALRASVLRNLLVFSRTNHFLYASVSLLAIGLVESEEHTKLVGAALREVVEKRRSLDAVGVEAYSAYARLKSKGIASARKPLRDMRELLESPFYPEVGRLVRRDVLFALLTCVDKVRVAAALPIIHEAVARTPEEQRNRERLSVTLVELAKTLPKKEKNEVLGVVLAHPRHAVLAKKKAADVLGYYARQWPYGSAMRALVGAQEEIFGPNPFGRKLAAKEIRKTESVTPPRSKPEDPVFEERLRCMKITTITGAGLALG